MMLYWKKTKAQISETYEPGYMSNVIVYIDI